MAESAVAARAVEVAGREVAMVAEREAEKEVVATVGVEAVDQAVPAD